MPFLLLKAPDGRLSETEVGDCLLVGRGAACGLRIEDDLASRQHAQIDRAGDQYILRDLGSRNGTRLNGASVGSAPLAFGDEIAIGHIRLLFVEQAPSALVGSDVAGYRVLEQIGSGGMGIVYRAHQLTLDRVVALKVLHPRLIAQPKFITRFLREARAAGALNHVNLVHVHDVGQWRDTYYYAMEYVDGHTVFEELRRHGAFLPSRAIAITLQVATALAHAHARGILHRDVKPENIMLANDGTAKLADLGLATSAQLEDPNRERGPDGRIRVWGSPSYMAPEVATGRAADPRSDLYSLGATLFHMLAGRAPFHGGTASEILKKHVAEPLPDLHHLAPHPIPQDIIPIIERLMAKRPERRYPTADELIADLTVVRQVIRQAAGEHGTRHVSSGPDQPQGPGPLRRLLDRWFGTKPPSSSENPPPAAE